LPAGENGPIIQQLHPTIQRTGGSVLKRIALTTIIGLLLSFSAIAQKGGSHSSSTHSSSRSSTAASKPSKTSVPKKSTVAQRNSKGKIKRSATARKDFMKQTGYAKGRKGYVVDHVVPLECGGSDAPSNMRWQTIAEGKIKDRMERNCRRE
jgi:hypothetical protein